VQLLVVRGFDRAVLGRHSLPTAQRQRSCRPRSHHPRHHQTPPGRHHNSTQDHWSVHEQPGFDDRFETLFHGLQDDLRLMPESIITASEQAVRIAGTNLADISTRHAAANRDIVTTVVRLHR
jgi:hypothetical protein